MNKFHNIVVTEENYKKLRQFGSAGNSLNDCVSYLMKEREELIKR
jgi:hypothetical protein